MYHDAVFEDPHSLQCVSDWFVTQKLAKIWNDNEDYPDAEELAEWYNGYKNRKTLKKKKNPDRQRLVTCRMVPFLIMGLVYTKG